MVTGKLEGGWLWPGDALCLPGHNNVYTSVKAHSYIWVSIVKEGLVAVYYLKG